MPHQKVITHNRSISVSNYQQNHNFRTNVNNTLQNYYIEHGNTHTQNYIQNSHCHSQNTPILNNNIPTGDVQNNNTQNCHNNHLNHASRYKIPIETTNVALNYQNLNYNNDYTSTTNLQIYNTQFNDNLVNSLSNHTQINSQQIYNPELNTAQHNSQIFETQQNSYNISRTNNNTQYRNRFNIISTEIVKDFMKKEHLLNINSLYRITIINEFNSETTFLQKIDHAYETRRRLEGRYKIPTYKNMYGKNTIAVQLPTTLNKLPNDVLNITNKTTFKINLKKL